VVVVVGMATLLGRGVTNAWIMSGGGGEGGGG